MRPNCSAIVPEPFDISPIRSPQQVHSLLASYVRGKEIVELGTRNGDGIACFAQSAASAVAVEIAPKYCAKLTDRAAGLPPGRSFKVLCKRF